jgi:hypothetical protein
LFEHGVNSFWRDESHQPGARSLGGGLGQIHLQKDCIGLIAESGTRPTLLPQHFGRIMLSLVYALRVA